MSTNSAIDYPMKMTFKMGEIVGSHASHERPESRMLGVVAITAAASVEEMLGVPRGESPG